MKKFLLERNQSTVEGTTGTMHCVGDPSVYFFTMELPWRENKRALSCIPEGVYIAKPYASPSKGSVYLLKNVPNRSFIEIHSANFGGDRSESSKGKYQSQLLGCIALGEKIDRLSNMYQKKQLAVLNSRAAQKRFLAYCNGEAISLEIRWAEGQGPQQ